MSPGIQIIDPEERFTVTLEGAELTIRRIDSASLMAIERRHQGGKDRQRVNDDVLDYVLRDWQGVGDPLGGAEVPCTRENKLKLPTSVKLKVLAAAQMPQAHMPQGKTGRSPVPQNETAPAQTTVLPND